MTNVYRVQFSDSLTEKLMNELRNVVLRETYNEIKFCELIGVLEMLKTEFTERQTK